MWCLARPVSNQDATSVFTLKPSNANPTLNCVTPNKIAANEIVGLRRRVTQTTSLNFETSHPVGEGRLFRWLRFYIAFKTTRD